MGSLRGRVAREALKGGQVIKAEAGKVLVSAPGPGGMGTVMEYQEMDGVRYFDSACFVNKPAAEPGACK